MIPFFLKNVDYMKIEKTDLGVVAKIASKYFPEARDFIAKKRRANEVGKELRKERVALWDLVTKTAPAETKEELKPTEKVKEAPKVTAEDLIDQELLQYETAIKNIEQMLAEEKTDALSQDDLIRNFKILTELAKEMKTTGDVVICSYITDSAGEHTHEEPYFKHQNIRDHGKIFEAGKAISLTIDILNTAYQFTPDKEVEDKWAESHPGSDSPALELKTKLTKTLMQIERNSTLGFYGTAWGSLLEHIFFQSALSNNPLPARSTFGRPSFYGGIGGFTAFDRPSYFRVGPSHEVLFPFRPMWKEEDRDQPRPRLKF